MFVLLPEVSGWVNSLIIPGCVGAVQHGRNAWWGLLHLTAVREQKRKAGRVAEPISPSGHSLPST